MLIGHQILHFKRLPSTNAYGLGLVRTEPPQEGLVIFTDDQYDGKGQLGRTWESEPGSNIACSIILYPDFLAAKGQFLLNMAIALAVRDTIAEAVDTDCRIKWPNDIVCNNKKIAGILIENIWTGSRWSACIAGIGINVNQTHFEGTFQATSVRNISGVSNKLSDLLQAMFGHLNKGYKLLKQDQGNEILQRFNAHLLGIGQYVTLQFDDAHVETYMLQAVNTDGQLIASDRQGKRFVFNHGEVRQLM